ncbi:hypothetical protein FRB93_009643 [Tulasnella sp. JGI-2019a]|nr:hypothetical protein FRB93_009643 [Tulasnella sp. JGI-2019a]
MFPNGQYPGYIPQNGHYPNNLSNPPPQNAVALVQPTAFPQFPLTPEQEYMALQNKHYIDRLLLVQQQARELAAAGLLNGGVGGGNVQALPPVQPIAQSGYVQQSGYSQIYTDTVGTNYALPVAAQGNIVEVPSSSQRPSSTSHSTGGFPSGGRGDGWEGSSHSHVPLQNYQQHTTSQGPSRHRQTSSQRFSDHVPSTSQSSFSNGPMKSLANAPMSSSYQSSNLSKAQANGSTAAVSDHSCSGGLPQGTLEKVLGVLRSAPQDAPLEPVSISSAQSVPSRPHAEQATTSLAPNPQLKPPKGDTSSSSRFNTFPSQLSNPVYPTLNPTRLSTNIMDTASVSGAKFSGSIGVQGRNDAFVQQAVPVSQGIVSQVAQGAIVLSSSLSGQNTPVPIAATWVTVPNTVLGNAPQPRASPIEPTPSLDPVDTAERLNAHGVDGAAPSGGTVVAGPSVGAGSASTRGINAVQHNPKSRISHPSPPVPSLTTSSGQSLLGDSAVTSTGALIPNQEPPTSKYSPDALTIPADTFWTLATMTQGVHVREVRATKADLNANWLNLKAKLANEPEKLKQAQGVLAHILHYGFDQSDGRYLVHQGSGPALTPAPSMNVPTATLSSQHISQKPNVRPSNTQGLQVNVPSSSDAIQSMSQKAGPQMMGGAPVDHQPRPAPSITTSQASSTPLSSLQLYKQEPQSTLVQQQHQWHPVTAGAASSPQWPPNSRPTTSYSSTSALPQTATSTSAAVSITRPSVAAVGPEPDAQALINAILKNLGPKKKRRRTKSEASGRGDEGKAKMRTEDSVALQTPKAAEDLPMPVEAQSLAEPMPDAPSEAISVLPVELLTQDTLMPERISPTAQLAGATPSISPPIMAQPPILSPLPSVHDLASGGSTVPSEKGETPPTVVSEIPITSLVQEKLSPVQPARLFTPRHTPPIPSPSSAVDPPSSAISISSPEVEPYNEDHKPLFLPSTPPSEDAPLFRSQMSPAPPVHSPKDARATEAILSLDRLPDASRRLAGGPDSEVDELAEDVMVSRPDRSQGLATRDTSHSDRPGKVATTSASVRRLHFPDRTWRLTVEIPWRPDIINAAKRARSARCTASATVAVQKRAEDAVVDGTLELEAAIWADTPPTSSMNAGLVKSQLVPDIAGEAPGGESSLSVFPHISQTSALSDYPHRQILMSCKWAGCKARLDSIYRYKTHIKTSHVGTPVGGWKCKWRNCKHDIFKSGHTLYEHIKQEHVNTLWPCPYLSCDGCLQSEAFLLRHIQLQHQDPKGTLRKLGLPEALEIGPHPKHIQSPSMPVYEVMGLAVKPASMSPARHNTLGPWVLRHIFGPPVAVPASPRKHLAQRERSPEGQHNNMDEYDYLRKPGDEIGRNMATLQSLDNLVDHVNYTSGGQRSPMALLIQPTNSQHQSLQSARQQTTAHDTETGISSPTTSNHLGVKTASIPVQEQHADVFDFGPVDTSLLNDE